MTNVIVAFPKPEDAKSIRNILVKNGFPVVAVCTSGAQTLQYADDLHIEVSEHPRYRHFNMPMICIME